ncbi:glycerol-3-phosphate dehydrogenase C-terminal domain-containing protein [Neobacillus jeddahensis]|uniref:glycerol-3-phosphate dehydrogenase C-terminal domain-containing protein n=1 Tax=Neobacillus jeddahensis TaxID=1461580 RepID=UPI003709B12C
MSGGNFPTGEKYQQFIIQKSKEAVQFGLTEQEGFELAKKYGTNVDQLFTYANHYSAESEEDLSPFVFAQLMYSIEQEMAVTPMDFFIRRTGALYFQIDWIRKWKNPILKKMEKIMNWSPAELISLEKQLEQELNHAVIPENTKTL